MSRRNDAERARDAAQARMRRRRDRVPLPVPREMREPRQLTDAFGKEPTPQQTLSLAETIQHGSMKAAAACLGLAPETVKSHLCSLYQRTGAESLANAPLVLGWLVIPRRWRRPHDYMRASSIGEKALGRQSMNAGLS